MDQIRAFGEWIARHKFFSTFIAIFFISGFFGIRFLLDNSNGQVSDPITRGDVADAVYGIGTVTANRRYTISPLTGNHLSRSFVREGDKVKKGQPLLMTDDGVRFSAPFDGVANYFPIRPGENAIPSMPMLVFTDMADRYVLVSMEQQSALRVKPGQNARLSFDALRNTTFEGKVTAVYSYANNFLARVDSVNLPESVLPDMTCDVAIVINKHENALLIPITAFDNGRVWVVRGHSIARPAPIKLGVTDGTMAEVISGDLQEGDRVMIRNQVGR